MSSTRLSKVTQASIDSPPRQSMSYIAWPTNFVPTKFMKIPDFGTHPPRWSPILRPSTHTSACQSTAWKFSFTRLPLLLLTPQAAGNWNWVRYTILETPVLFGGRTPAGQCVYIKFSPFATANVLNLTFTQCALHSGQFLNQVKILDCLEIPKLL